MVTSDMSHVTSSHENFSWGRLFKFNTILHEPLCTAFRHRRVQSMSRRVQLSVSNELKQYYKNCLQVCRQCTFYSTNYFYHLEKIDRTLSVDML